MVGLAQLSLGLGALRNARTDGPDPEPSVPVTIFEASPALDANDNNASTTFRVVCQITDAAQTRLRITLAPGTTNALTVVGLGFGKRTTGEPLYPNTTATPVEALFGGQSGFIAATTPQTSDWMDCEALGLVDGDEIVVSYTTGGSGQASTRYNAAATNADTFFQTGTHWNVANTVGLGFNLMTGRNFGVVSIETRIGDEPEPEPEENDIPLTFDDPMFTGMEELTSMVTLSDGQDLTRKSFIHMNASPASILSLGNNEVTYCRVDSNECVRVTGSLSIDHCYLEATGEGEAHADTIQTYSPGERGVTLSITNSTVRAHTVAATAGLFVADDWGGNVLFESVMFHGGPFGLRCQAGTAAGASLVLSLKDVFFVGPFGFQPYSLEEYGDGTITIEQWDNVRHATIVDGVLVPGELIPSPTG